MFEAPNRGSARSIPVEQTPARRTVKIYDRQEEFSRGLQAMQRAGWALQSFHQPESDRALGIMRASGPGMVPQVAQAQIVAHFVCATGSSRPSPALRSRMAKVLLQIAARLDKLEPAAGEDTVCTNPA